MKLDGLTHARHLGAATKEKKISLKGRMLSGENQNPIRFDCIEQPIIQRTLI